MRYETAQISLLGNRRQNEDRYCVMAAGNRVLLVVADGMGGHPRGERAAQILIDTCEPIFIQETESGSPPGERLLRMLSQAHERIISYGTAQSPPISPRTTAVIAIVQDHNAYWAHVGDSRLYLFRNGQPLTRTTDHSYVEQLHQQGLISGQECRTHPYRHYVTRCLGGDSQGLEVTLGKPTQLKRGDTLLLCSDGFWTALPDEAISLALQSPLSLAEAIGLLAREAETLAQPESDNVTAVALRWLEDEPASLYKADGTQSCHPASGPKDNATKLTQAIDELKKAIDQFDKTAK